MKFAVITFPGSNCDQDVYHVASAVMNVKTDRLWYQDRENLSDYDCVMLPGGFSYGDYLRSGAIARFSPIMDSVIEYARKGGLVLGICNGFQILQEAGLLPGAMKRNNSLRFVCRFTRLEIVNPETPFSNNFEKGQVVRMPVAHNEGNFYIDEQGLKELRDNNQIVLKYLPGDNPNGSAADIAGVCSREGNVFGLMPHPERCAETILTGSNHADGRLIFQSIVDYLVKGGVAVG